MIKSISIAKNNQLHFLLLGESTGHITTEIETFNIKQAVIFTSENLAETNNCIIEQWRASGIDILEVVYLKPFEENALDVMTAEIHACYLRHQHEDIIVGLTGGTNLMAIAMALTAVSYGLICHYVAGQKGNVWTIPYLKKLHAAGGYE